MSRQPASVDREGGRRLRSRAGVGSITGGSGRAPTRVRKVSSRVLAPILDRLEGARTVLVAGAGGGFDVLAGIPLATGLRAAGKQVHLANLSFADLTLIPRTAWLGPAVAEVHPDTDGPSHYFPERTLARWLQHQDLPSTVYALARTGVVPLTAAYDLLAHHLQLDAIVLVDGGTDILMFGDESGLGTPEEDMASLAAVTSLAPVRGSTRLDLIVACIGFGIDAHHGVDHTQVLQNIATLERAGGYLGAASVNRGTPEGDAYLDAVAYAHSRTPARPSIVNGSIAAAIRGEYGNAQFTTRTQDTELFINPLMALYFLFDLPTLAAQSLYLETLADTHTIDDITRRIEIFRDTLGRTRDRRTFPH